eukprot:TRINITY_DN319_c0_g3_i2.p1 TRINITY_DN319_c0_g3~~TRINITY_DN319_c0_g3_i2.p1  ORF type:complete len:532 (+),score=106.10 TRINITY_DN319_c0_g3_i2:98-1693(+)
MMRMAAPMPMPRAAHAGFRAPPSSLVGQRVGKYRVEQSLGRGAFAQVFLGIEPGTGTRVALKLLMEASPQDIHAETSAHQAIAKADPRKERHICQLLNTENCSGRTVFVFPLMGPSLAEKLRSGQRGSPEQVALLARQMGEALSVVHFDCKLCHTDIKPENILLTRDGAGIGSSFALCDFGSSSFYSTTPDRDLVCTGPYRPPEVLASRPWSYAVDYWSLGCVLYEARVGSRLFETRDAQHHWQLLERKLGAAPRWLQRRASAPPQMTSGNPLGAAPELHGERDFASLLQDLLQWDPVKRLRGDEIPHHRFVVQLCGAPASAKRTSLPASPYTAGGISTPGCAELQRSGSPAPRIPAGQAAHHLSREVGYRPAHTRSSSAEHVARPAERQQLQPHMLPPAGRPTFARRGASPMPSVSSDDSPGPSEASSRAASPTPLPLGRPPLPPAYTGFYNPRNPPVAERPRSVTPMQPGRRAASPVAHVRRSVSPAPYAGQRSHPVHADPRAMQAPSPALGMYARVGALPLRRTLSYQ